MKNVKISSLQLALLMYPTIIATAILSVPSTTAGFAKQDLWLSPIFASIIGFMTMYFSFKLFKRFPNHTVIQFSELIIGKVPGKVLSLIILLFYIQTSGFILRDYGEFIVSSFLLETPLIFIISSMVLLCAVTVYAGIEVLARMGQILFPFFVGPFLLLIILLSPEFELGNILPIFEEGIKPPMKGAIVPSGWFTEFFIIAFLLPSITDKERWKKHGIWTILWIMATLVIVNLSVLFTLGSTTASKLYPLMQVSRYVRYADFFENLDAITMSIWILGAFIKISVFFYAIVIGTAQLFNLSDYRPIIWPIGILLIEFSYWALPSMMFFTHHGNLYFPFYAVVIQTIIPALLLLIAMIRKKENYE